MYDKEYDVKTTKLQIIGRADYALLSHSFSPNHLCFSVVLSFVIALSSSQVVSAPQEQTYEIINTRSMHNLGLKNSFY